MKETIIQFLSSRANLTVFQGLLYGIIGYIMGNYLAWFELAIMFVMMFLIQFITRTKAVADGMMFRQMMMDNQIEANEVIRRIKKEADRARKNNDIN